MKQFIFAFKNSDSLNKYYTFKQKIYKGKVFSCCTTEMSYSDASQADTSVKYYYTIVYHSVI